MATASTPPRPLRLSGAPGRLQGLLPPSAWHPAAGLPRVSIEDLDSDAISVQVATLPGGSARALRLELPTSTPPGTYSGVVRLTDTEHRLTIDVTPCARLASTAVSLEVSAPPSGDAVIELEVVNVGNVSYEIPERYGVGLFDVDGVERSIAVGFSSRERGVDRVGVIADELAEGHGSIAILHVEEGAGELTPGELRTLRARLRLSSHVTGGHTYFGYWSIQEGKCTVNIRVAVPAVREVS